jgi:glycosidase
MSAFVIRFLAVALFVLAACSPANNKIPPPMEVAPVQKMVIYQMMVRLFGNTTTTNKPFGSIDENGVGKFNDVTVPALQSLKELGITHVWYTGVIEHATMTDYSYFGIPKDDPDVIKGRAGSPYAIKDYYDVDPDLAESVPDRMKEFEALVDRTHAQGLKVLIDFVPNHVARSYKSDAKPEGVQDLGEGDDLKVSFKPSNNFYYLPGESFRVPAEAQALAAELFPSKDGRFEENPAKVSGNGNITASPKMSDWFETVKINYGIDIQHDGKVYFDPIPSSWEKMRDILMYWTRKKVDGFRCDMAQMVPVEFWNWVIPQIKQVNPEVIFIAEIYIPSMYRNYISIGQFDYLYDKVQLYDTLRLLINHQRSSLDVNAVQESLTDINQQMLHFLENHDEHRIASPFFAQNPLRALPAMTISATIDQGAVLIYFGQEVGEPASGNPGYQNIEQSGTTTKMDYWGVPELQKWVNNGTFNDSLLSDSQKRLRTYYKTLLNIAQQNQAITKGKYADLTEFNVKAGHFNEQVHAFVRYDGSEKLIIVNSFNDTPLSVKVALPTQLIEEWQLAQETTYSLTDLFWNETVALQQGSFTITLKPYSSYIFNVQQP